MRRPAGPWWQAANLPITQVPRSRRNFADCLDGGDTGADQLMLEFQAAIAGTMTATAPAVYSAMPTTKVPARRFIRCTANSRPSPHASLGSPDNPQTAGIKKTTRQHLVVFYGLVAEAVNGYRAAEA